MESEQSKNKLWVYIISGCALVAIGVTVGLLATTSSKPNLPSVSVAPMKALCGNLKQLSDQYSSGSISATQLNAQLISSMNDSLSQLPNGSSGAMETLKSAITSSSSPDQAPILLGTLLQMCKSYGY
jgi:hypothetical protein